MKNILKISIAIFLISSTGLFAQGLQGKAYYQAKTTFEMNTDDSPESMERQKMFKEMMKKRFEKVYELNFNDSESVYKEEEQLAQPGRGGMRMFGGFNSGSYYKNIQSKTLVKEQNLMGKEFLIKDDLEVLNWTLEKESKMIGQHFCLKATAVKEVSGEQFRFGPPPRGQKNKDKDEEEKETVKEIIITAWYTPEIPVGHGPGEYWGLPGLILEVNAGKTQIVCTKIVINPKDKVKIKVPEKGKVITQEKYKKLSSEKIKEMRERFGNRNRKGRERRGPL